MAGDWIKLETGTPFKPEILRIAETLGLDRRTAFGIVAEFWCWLDQNCSDGKVTHLSLQSIDAVTQTPGFAHAYSEVGWGKLNLSTGTLTIKHWDRHNGKSAKTRALSQERMKRKRYADSVTNREPEKRREELYKPSVVVTPTVEQKTKTHNTFGKNGTTKTDRWDASDEGIERKGKELGILAHPGEDYFQYKGRLWQAINLAKRGKPKAEDQHH